jgi:hypothetical protein
MSKKESLFKILVSPKMPINNRLLGNSNGGKMILLAE